MKISMEYPEWMVDEFDREAERLGVARTAIIKMWLSDQIDMKQKREEVS